MSYEWRGTIAKVNTKTNDGRILEADTGEEVPARPYPLSVLVTGRDGYAVMCGLIGSVHYEQNQLQAEGVLDLGNLPDELTKLYMAGALIPCGIDVTTDHVKYQTGSATTMRVTGWKLLGLRLFREAEAVAWPGIGIRRVVDTPE